MSTRFRQDVHDHVLATMLAVQAANPSTIRKVWHARPATYAGEKPLVYIGELRERWTHDSGTRRRELTGTVHVVDVLTDNAETDDRSNVVVDLLCDAFTAVPHVGGQGGLFEAIGVHDAEDEQGPVAFSDTVIDFEAVIQEGRS